MSEGADGFKLVQRKKKGRGPTNTQRGENLLEKDERYLGLVASSEGKRSIDKAAVQKKIFLAKEELMISDFYRSFQDSLELVQSLKMVSTANPTSTSCLQSSERDSEELILQHTNNPLSNSNPCLSERVHGSTSPNHQETTVLEGENSKWRTTLSLDDVKDMRMCTLSESHEDTIKSWKSTRLHVEEESNRTDNRHCGGTKDEKVTWVKGHPRDKVTDLSVWTVVCYGLGNFSDCIIARYQLALMMLMCDFLKVTATSCHVYDPRFTAEERQILTSLGLDVIPQNEEGKRLATGPTLFYMPHCGKPLYNNLLWANWSEHGLSNIAVIGNSFSSVKERLPSRVLEKDFHYLHQIMPYMREVPVKNNFRFTDIFNDTSIHLFPLERLQKIPPTFWDEHDEPQYNPDAATEIILK